MPAKTVRAFEQSVTRFASQGAVLPCVSLPITFGEGVAYLATAWDATFAMDDAELPVSVLDFAEDACAFISQFLSTEPH